MPELKGQYITTLTIGNIKKFMNVNFKISPDTGRNTEGQKSKNQLYAVGRYQITPVTLYDFKNLDDQQQFNVSLQDKLGRAILKNKPSITNYLSKGENIDNAVIGLSQIWSSIATNLEGNSYYNNERVTVSFNDAKNALEKLYRSIKANKITL